MSGKLLTIEDVAERCQVTPQTVRSWQYNNKISFIKLPQGIRIREEHFENWLESRTVKAKKKIA